MTTFLNRVVVSFVISSMILEPASAAGFSSSVTCCAALSADNRSLLPSHALANLALGFKSMEHKPGSVDITLAGSLPHASESHQIVEPSVELHVGDLARDRQDQAYRETWDKTEGLTVAPAVFVPPSDPKLSIALMSGHRTETGDASDFTPEMMAAVSALYDELMSAFPFLREALMPLGRLHTTLFIPFLLQPFNFLELTDRDTRIKAYGLIREAWEKQGPIEIIYQGVLLVPNGDLLIEGHIQSGALEELRNELLRLILPLNPAVKLAGRFSHISLARSAAPTWNEFARLRDWVRKNRGRPFASVLLRQPILYAYSDYNGRIVNEAAKAELVEWNRNMAHELPLRNSRGERFREFWEKRAVPEAEVGDIPNPLTWDVPQDILDHYRAMTPEQLGHEYRELRSVRRPWNVALSDQDSDVLQQVIDQLSVNPRWSMLLRDRFRSAYLMSRHMGEEKLRAYQEELGLYRVTCEVWDASDVMHLPTSRATKTAA